MVMDFGMTCSLNAINEMNHAVTIANHNNTMSVLSSGRQSGVKFENIFKVSDGLKAKLNNKYNPTNDEFVNSNNQTNSIKLVNRTIKDNRVGGMTKDGKLWDGIKLGKQNNTAKIVSRPIMPDNRVGSMTKDGKLWDGIKLGNQNNTAKIVSAPIAGITAPGIHQNEKGIIDGVKPGITANGELVTVSEDGHFSVTSQDGKITDGRFAPRQKPAMIY